MGFFMTVRPLKLNWINLTNILVGINDPVLLPIILSY